MEVLWVISLVLLVLGVLFAVFGGPWLPCIIAGLVLAMIYGISTPRTRRW